MEEIVNHVSKRLKIEDFNRYQTKKFDDSSQKIRKILDQEIKKVSQHHEEYKIEKMVIKSKVKVRNLEAQKKKYK